MKKIIVAVCALALLGATSCKKDETKPVGEENIPTYTEGRYQPYAQIASVNVDGALSQEWFWSDKNLDHIVLAEGGQIAFNYSGNYISRVTNSGSDAEEIRYYYTDNAFTKCEVYYNNVLSITMDLLHNAAGKVSSAQLTIDDNYLLNLAMSIIGQGFALEKMVGPKAIEQMVMMAKLATRNDSKISVGDKNFTMNLVWNGDDLSQQIVNGSVIINITTEDLDMIAGLVPEDYQSYIQLLQTAMAFTGGSLPLTMSINDTISMTYDANYNPKFCYWGEIFSAENLSLHNVLTQTSSGATSLSISMMGQTTNLFSRPFDDYKEYTYQYNDKKYPTQVSGSNKITYTYKQ